MIETTHSVIAFIDSYRAAFERLDAAAIAEHFAYPGHLASGGGDEVLLVPVTERAEWTRQIERLIAEYREVDFGRTRVLDVRIIELAPNLVQAAVHWGLEDAAGRRLYTFTSSYTLVRDAVGTTRIAAVAHDEQPKLRACLKRLRDAAG